MRTPADDTSASYAAEVARLLWPEPWGAPVVTRSRRRSGQPHRDAYLFPSARRPRLLVPADVPGAASMLQRLGSGRGRLAVPARALLERSVRSSAFPLLGWPVLRVCAPDAGADSIERHLADRFGHDVRVGVMLGTRRVTQKPVLQVFHPDGRLLGYAKIGHNDLTAPLVRREATSLAALGRQDIRTFAVPRVLHHGQWSGLEVLVISELRTDPRAPVTAGTREAAMRELAHLDGTTTSVLTASSFWTRLMGEVGALSQEPDGPRLRAAADAVEARHGDQEVDLGGWHGDWGHWNMGMGGGVLQLWDWERHDPCVPVGFDAVHYAAQCVRPGHPDAHDRDDELLRSVPAALERMGVGPDRHDLTLDLYLLEIAARYVEALRHGATPALERRTSWALSLLQRGADHQPTPLRGRP